MGECDCGDDFCQSISARQTIRRDSRTALAIDACRSCMLVLDVVDGRVMYIEVLDRPPMRRQSAEH